MAQPQTYQLLQTLASAGVMPTPAALALLERQAEPEALLLRYLAGWDQRKVFCDIGDLEEVLETLQPEGLVPSGPAQPPGAGNELPEPPIERQPAPPKGLVRVEGPPLKVLEEVGEAPEGGTGVEDFAAYFGNRYRALAQLVRRRAAMREAVDIGRLDQMLEGAEVRVVAMIREINRTPKGLRVQLEDPTGTILATNYDDPAHFEAQLLVDEVVGVVGRRHRRLNQLKLLEVHRPSLERSLPPPTATPPVAVAFISDIHVGSRTFLESAWERFLAWARQEGGPHPELARQLGYLVINGDAVDGIDSYPDQEKDLLIKDYQQQYRKLGETLATLPPHLQIILLPGNHDAVRLMEPQPALPPPLQALLPDNVTCLANPATFELAGVRVLAYHGKSLDDLVTHLPTVSYENPLTGMQELLERRHLAPVFGDKTPIAPRDRDGHVIRQVPHIFVTGHVHATGVKRYKGVLLVNPGTWQSQTDYQKMMNFFPDPGKAVVVQLKGLAPHVLDFNT